MAVIAFTTGVARPVAEVFAYATDPTRFAEWQKGVVDGHMTSDREQLEAHDLHRVRRPRHRQGLGPARRRTAGQEGDAREPCQAEAQPRSLTVPQRQGQCHATHPEALTWVLLEPLSCLPYVAADQLGIPIDRAHRAGYDVLLRLVDGLGEELGCVSVDIDVGDRWPNEREREVGAARS